MALKIRGRFGKKNKDQNRDGVKDGDSEPEFKSTPE